MIKLKKTEIIIISTFFMLSLIPSLLFGIFIQVHVYEIVVPLIVR